MPFNLTYLSGNNLVNYEFTHIEQCKLWQAWVSRIKALNAAVATDNIPPDAALEARVREWMKEVDQFCKEYGNTMVPSDIQYTYADAHFDANV